MKLSNLLVQHTKPLLIFIILLATFLRFYGNTTVPVSLYWDEVAVGYSALNILETGKDEYGHPFPLLFESYNDFKMPVYVYLTTLPIALFGLNEFSIRFISAAGGVVTVLMSFLVTRELLKRSSSKKTDIIPLIVASLLTIAPWHIQFSRVGFESNLALLFITSGVFFLLKATKQPKYLIPTVFLFALSCYTYRSEIVFAPLFFMGLILYLRKSFSRRNLLIALTSFLLLLSPLALAFSGGDERASQVTIFSLQNPHVMQAAEKREEAGDALWAKVLYNRRVVYAQVALSQYISHFLLDYLFLKGDTNMRHTVSGYGLFYLWQLPFFFLGIIAVISKYKKIGVILLLWIACAPLAASVSIPAPHALRSLPMLVPLLIVIAFGIEKAYLLIRKNTFKRAFVLALIGITIISSIYFGKAYTYHNGVLASSEWGDGYKQLISYVKEHEKKYDKVIITGHYWQPYMYTLFYTKYDVEKYQQNGSSIQFDKYYFGGTSWDQDRGRGELDHENLEKVAGTKNALIALSPQEYKSQEHNLQKLSEIYDHNNNLVFIISTLR